jgi:hypothetical protein
MDEMFRRFSAAAATSRASHRPPGSGRAARHPLTLQLIQNQFAMLLEYAKASFERIKQRLRHLWALARVKRVLNNYTLANDLGRQFGDVLVGLRKMIHGPPRYEEQPLPIGRLLGRNEFKCYNKCFTNMVNEHAA